MDAQASHCRENPDIYDWPFDALEGDFIEKDMAGLLLKGSRGEG
ncbi:hypothetical protein [Paenibacillus polysaccharolyticus]|nr:hypothetical protein [Paenibacillus xylanexedens]MDP9700362.1 hypothetical protein [Paenibacillus intestini]